MRLLTLLLLLGITKFSQAQQITGLAKDENGAPINGGTVSLLKAKDSSTIKLAITSANGSYSFSRIKEGDYKVLLNSVGYVPAFSPKFTLGTSDVNVEEIKLFKIKANLANVTVTSKRP
ncbi:MAG TPA: carboxypeptidase-like regulatory domain-containing protein, partial [Ferruginibacter sp.]|nr:carboxypeptidase-like regulatory domain-containing protein [Ferruginibacter sp.]